MRMIYGFQQEAIHSFEHQKFSWHWVKRRWWNKLKRKQYYVYDKMQLILTKHFFYEKSRLLFNCSYQSLERSNLKADEIMTSQLRVTELQPQWGEGWDGAASAVLINEIVHPSVSLEPYGRGGRGRTVLLAVLLDNINFAIHWDQQICQKLTLGTNIWWSFANWNMIELNNLCKKTILG